MEEKESRPTSPFSEDSEPRWDSGSEFRCIEKIPMKRKHEANMMIPITIPTAISPMPHAGKVSRSPPPTDGPPVPLVVTMATMSPQNGFEQYTSPDKWHSGMEQRHSGAVTLHFPVPGHMAHSSAHTWLVSSR